MKPEEINAWENRFRQLRLPQAPKDWKPHWPESEESSEKAKPFVWRECAEHLFDVKPVWGFTLAATWLIILVLWLNTPELPSGSQARLSYIEFRQIATEHQEHITYYLYEPALKTAYPPMNFEFQLQPSPLENGL